MATIKVNELNETVSAEEAAAVKGGYEIELEPVIITSYQTGGSSSAGFRGGVRVATGDVKG